jgi:hypothetical protein
LAWKLPFPASFGNYFYANINNWPWAKLDKIFFSTNMSLFTMSLTPWRMQACGELPQRAALLNVGEPLAHRVAASLTAGTAMCHGPRRGLYPYYPHSLTTGL